MLKRAKSAGRISRPYYECRSVQKEKEELHDHTMNVKCAGRISRPDYNCGTVRRVQIEYKFAKSEGRISRSYYECEECSKYIKTRL